MTFTRNYIYSQSSKMQVITDLLATGKYSNRQVAEMANTTAAYVAKIKSQIKK